MGQLEQALPLILGQKRLLERRASGILLLALRLPSADSLLLARERALVVLEVVGLSVVSLDAVQEQVAVLLQEGVDAKGEVVVVGGENSRLDEGSGFQSGQRWGKIRRSRNVGSLKLVDEGGDQVRVVNLHGKFNKDILVSQAGLLQSIIR